MTVDRRKLKFYEIEHRVLALQTYETHVDSGIFATVFGVDDNFPRQKKYQPYVMTSYGQEVVGLESVS